MKLYNPIGFLNQEKSLIRVSQKSGVQASMIVSRVIAIRPVRWVAAWMGLKVSWFVK